jgi:hypothetical protein
MPVWFEGRAFVQAGAGDTSGLGRGKREPGAFQVDANRNAAPDANRNAASKANRNAASKANRNAASKANRNAASGASYSTR